jgi:flagellar hook-associated protein 2
MAGLTSQGIGSGLDVASLVAKLVAAEKAPRQAQITRAQTGAVTTISALGSLKGAMAAFNDSLSALKTEEVFASRSATSSDQEFFSATAGAAAMAGSYDIEIEQLASAQQLTSNAFASGAGHVVGTGTLTIGVGTKTFAVPVDAEHKTLAQIRDAINAAPENTNLVRATIVNATDGAHLMLTAQNTGATNGITVAQADGDGGLASLTYNGTLTTNYTELHKALDAVVYIAGFAHHSATNTITDAIDGVTITALKADDDVTHSLTIANDTNSTQARIKKFVDSYNDLSSQMATLRSYEPTTKKAGPLLGDALLRGIETDVRNKLAGAVSGLTGDYKSLASIGITTDRNGVLKLDSDKLAKAMTADFDGVAKLFGSADGVAARLSASLTSRLADTAELNMRSKALNQKTASLQKEQAALETRMLDVQRRYNQQFNALDSLLSNMQSQSSFLSQQLAGIAKIGSS